MRRTATLLAGLTLALLLGVGGLSAYLHATARRAVDELLSRRLEAVGSTAARLIEARAVSESAPGASPDPILDRALADVAAASELDGAYLFDEKLRVVADAHGRSGRPANLLRLDPDRGREALSGKASVGWGFDVDGLHFLAGYFPVRSKAGPLALAVEAGAAFNAPSRRLRTAAIAAFTLEALLGGLALVALALAVRAAGRERVAFARAEQASLASRMAATVAHEVRNPLGIIRGGAELLRERSSAPRDRELLDDILGEVSRLNLLTEEFLDLAREQPLRPEPVALAELARQSGDKVRLGFPELAVETWIRPPLDDEARVVADPARVRQVLLNLMLNGAQATSGQGRLRVELSAEPSGGVRVAVEDDGPGVAAEMASRLFDPFQSGRVGGTGLGLAIARRIVEQHGGTLALVSSLRGARFEFNLPGSPPTTQDTPDTPDTQGE